MKARYRNKAPCLVLASRAITSRYRHFMNDLVALMPHAKKEAKFDGKGPMNLISEIADSRNCKNILYFECRK